MLKPKNLDDMRLAIEKNQKNLTSDALQCRDLIKQCQELDIKEDQTLTIDQVSEILGVSKQTIRNWESSGKLIPHVKTKGGHRRYLESQVKALRKAQLSIPEIILPDISVKKLRELGDMLLSSFSPNEKVNLTISQGVIDNKVRITIDSEDGLTTICKTFSMEE